MANDLKLEKIFGLLLVQLMREDDFPSKVRALIFAGFSHSDIAEMIGNTTAHSVAQTAYTLRKSAGGKRKKQKVKKAG